MEKVDWFEKVRTPVAKQATEYETYSPEVTALLEEIGSGYVPGDAEIVLAFQDFAKKMASWSNGPEVEAGLRCLLEAKNHFVGMLVDA